MTMTVRPEQTLPPLDGALLPAFDVPRAGGGRVQVRGYRGRRGLALYFLHDAKCAGCRALVTAVVPRYGDYALADAEPLVIVPAPAAEVEALRCDLALPFPVLIDEGSALSRRYGVRDGEAALMVTDRFGVPVLWQRAGADHDLPDQDAVLREVEYLSYTCSGGCATPIWSDVP